MDGFIEIFDGEGLYVWGVFGYVDVGGWDLEVWVVFVVCYMC